MTANPKLLLLRRLLAEQAPVRSGGEGMETGLASLDRLGLPRGSVTEVVADPGKPGGALLLAGLLEAAAARHRVALLDGSDAFDPASVSPGLRLLWVRCRGAVEAARAADLVVRDGNVSLAVLLLSLAPARELRRLAAPVWHRLQVMAEKTGTALVAFTPSPQIGNARLRLAAGGAFTLDDVETPEGELADRLALAVLRRRAAPVFVPGETDDRLAVGA